MASSDDAQTFQTSERGSQRLAVIGQVLRLIGSLLLALGTIGAILATAAIAVALFWSRVPLDLATRAFVWSGTGLLAATTLRHFGRSAGYAASRRGLTVKLNEDGAVWSGPSTGKVAWSALRHVFVAGTPAGARRLVFATQPVDAVQLAATSALSQLARRLWSPDRFALDLPLDELSQPPAMVLAAIHEASAGRFPDSQTTPNGEAEERRS